ncbi:replicative DNA helicase [Actinoplanes sp. NPDC051851]|uniref:replicative DNA helicase n=1 Tax=Actinoplanes sp. NPDC051851 TaxID=3154753 RepID=UPI00342DD3C4
MSITDDARPEPRPPSQPSGGPPGGDGGGKKSGPPGGGGGGGGGGYDKAPPQDVGAEQGVLGGMLLSKDAIADVVEILKTNDFYRPVHSTIYDIILDLYGRGEPADALTVAAALADSGDLGRIGGVPYLHTLIESVPTAANASYYARIVSERAILRRLVEAGTKIVQLGYGANGNGGRDVDDIVDLAQQAIYDVTEKRVSEDFAALGDMLQPTLDEIEAVGASGGVMQGVPTGFQDLDRLLNGLHAGQLIIVAGRPGLGKALALDTPLPTPVGWTTMANVEVGDLLLDADGRPTTVTAVSPIMDERPCYEVEFSDGSVIVADAEHRWLTQTRKSRRSSAPGEVVTTEEIFATLRTETADRRLNHSVVNAGALQLPERDLLIPPYTLGAWLGGGHADGARLTSADPEIAAYVEADGFVVRPSGPMLYTIQVPEPEPLDERICVACGSAFVPRASSVLTCGGSCGRTKASTVIPRESPACVSCGTVTAATANGGIRCSGCHSRFGTVTGLLREAGVLANKHIPVDYLRASETQRRALLAGLLDTDGTVTSTGNAQYCSTSQALANDVFELVVSLGYRCTITTKAVHGRRPETSTAYVLNVTTDDQVFRLHRKNLAHKERLRGNGVRTGARFIVDVRPVVSVPVKCVSVDNANHLYLAGRAMIPTHNSTVSMDFARNAAIQSGCASAIFSLEMSKIEMVMRLLSAEARVPLHTLRSGQLSDDDWTKLARRMGEISQAPIFVDDTPNMNLMEIRAKARRLKQRHNLRLLVIDYLQLMSSPKKTESRQQEVSELSRGLKLLAKEIECPVIAVSQLNRGPEQRTDKRPQLSDLRESGCLTAATRVMRADDNSETTLGELLAGGYRDIPVWALNERLQYTVRTMTHVFPSGHRPVYRLTLTSGREIEATANHPFLTFGGWKALGDLAAGDRLAAPRHVPPPLLIRPWEEAEVVLLAHLLGDGSFVRRQPLRYASGDELSLTAVAEAAKHFGVTAVRDEYPAARVTTLRLPAPYRLARGRRNPITEWLDGLGLFGLRSHEKFLPEKLFALPKEQVKLFLKHLWATDGSVTVNKAGTGGRVYFSSTSRRMLEGVSRLLLRFGITGRLRAVAVKEQRPQFTLDVSGRDDQLRFLREIGVFGARAEQCDRLRTVLESSRSNTNVDTVPREVWGDVRRILVDKEMSHREFAEAIGTEFCGSALWTGAPSRQRLARIADVLGNADLELHATNDVFWDEIKSIEYVGEQDVFDATVMGTHNFIANGIATHNSIEQDADVVILLHRDDYYDKESPRAGEADFIVAKHRNGPTDTVTVAAQLHLSRFVDMAI